MLRNFGQHFFRAVWHIKTIILAMFTLVVAGAFSISIVEKMPFGDTLYFSFVTGLTIGYGDIVVETFLGRLIALLIGLIGILFTGLTVAAFVYAVRESLEETGKQN